MRPQTITFNAFGPFKDKVTIDFDELQGHHLFLITGPTGAGKTTIFDGITFALYGETSGQAREVDTLKSQFAPKTAESYVEFTFTVKGEYYKITRKPKQEIETNRGVTVRNQDVIFELPDGKVITKVNEVKDKIHEVFGLTSEQFRQIVMLPQGEFQKLLHAKSDERDKIFRMIFQTHSFQRFQDRIELDFKQKSSEMNRTKTILEQYIKQIDWSLYQEDLPVDLTYLNSEEIVQQLKSYNTTLSESRSSLIEQRNNLKNELNQISQQITLGNQRLQFENEWKQLVEEEKVLVSKDELIHTYKEQITFLKQIKELTPLYENMVQLDKNITMLNQQLEQSNHQLLDLNTQKKSFDELWNQHQIDYALRDQHFKKLNELEVEKEQLNHMQSLLHSIHQLTQEEEKFVQLDIEYNSQLNQWKEYLLQINSDKKSLEHKINEQSLIKDLLVQQEKQMDSVHSELERLTQIQQLTDQFNIENTTLLEIAEQVRIKQDELKQLEYFYHSNIAAILAKDLEEDQACPVCGSCSHPQLAHFNVDSIDQNQIELLKIELEKIVTLFSKQKDKVTTSKGQIDTLNEQRTTLSHSMEVEEALQYLQSHLQDMKTELISQKNKLKSIEHEIQTLKESISKEQEWNNAIQKKIEEIHSNQSKLIQNQTTQKNKHLELEDLKIKVTFTLEECVEQISFLNQWITTMDRKHKELSEDSIRLNSEIIRLETQIHSLNEQCSKTQIQHSQSNDLLQSELEILKVGSIVDFKEYLIQSKELNSMEEFILQYQRDLDSVRVKITHLNTQISQIENLDLSLLEEQLKQYKEQEQQMENTLETISSVLSNNVKTYNEFMKALVQFKEDLTHFEMLQNLNKIANGQNKEKITFERYVLAAYFEEIIVLANQRLMDMTDSRYQFLRKIDKGKGASQQGLDLEVFDSHTGQIRSVKTLSGGESFKASLSLALGLAEIVQNYAGGISLETMFIDEGFGSLDPDSLDTAIETLVSLQSTGRLVGIISHVTELKNRIEAKLLVEPSQEGSTVYFQV